MVYCAGFPKKIVSLCLLIICEKKMEALWRRPFSLCLLWPDILLLLPSVELYVKSMLKVDEQQM